MCTFPFLKWLHLWSQFLNLLKFSKHYISGDHLHDKQKHKNAQIPKGTQTKLGLNIYTQIQNKSTWHGGLMYKCGQLFTSSVLTIDTFYHMQSLCQQQGKAAWQALGKHASNMSSINCGSKWDGILWHIDDCFIDINLMNVLHCIINSLFLPAIAVVSTISKNSYSTTGKTSNAFVNGSLSFHPITSSPLELKQQFICITSTSNTVPCYGSCTLSYRIPEFWIQMQSESIVFREQLSIIHTGSKMMKSDVTTWYCVNRQTPIY